MICVVAHFFFLDKVFYIAYQTLTRSSFNKRSNIKLARAAFVKASAPTFALHAVRDINLKDQARHEGRDQDM